MRKPRKKAKPKNFQDALKNRRLHPKLRMVMNGNEEVNTFRAERCASIAVEPRLTRKFKTRRDLGTYEVAQNNLADIDRPPLEEPAGNVTATVFLRLSDASVKLPYYIRKASSRRDNIVVAEVPLDAIGKLKEDPRISEVNLGDNLVFSPPMDVESEDAELRPSPRSVTGRNLHNNGQGVLIGIIDVQGFDFSHPDFLDGEGQTRFLRIWDQGGTTRRYPDRKKFAYGSEILQKHMNKAIAQSGRLGLAPHELEPQSQRSRSSHATHVASIAAGNHGVCPEAGIIGVSLALADEDMDRRRTFFDATRLVHAIDYILEVADREGRPVAINISLGTNGHAHDGNSTLSHWIDHALSVPGRCICVAAGNAGQEAPAKPGDMGFITGRIHTSNRLPAAGLTCNIEWIVAGGGIADLSENECELWYSGQDLFAIAVRPPGSDNWVGPVEPGEFVENKQLDNGTFISIYNERFSPANGDNYIACYLSPPMSSTGTGGVTSGAWLIRIYAREVRDGRFHAWIERDDPRRFGKLGVKQGWAFPSFFSSESNVDNSSVSSLGCGDRVITVGNLDAARETVHITSSQGPTRDGRTKPEILAPGTGIVAANGFDLVDRRPWVRMTGTSMAAPFVTGVAGLMLAVEPSLTSAQVAGIIRRTATPLPGADYSWRDDAGFGRIKAEACVREAAMLKTRVDKTKS